jgi:MraZ protein
LQKIYFFTFSTGHGEFFAVLINHQGIFWDTLENIGKCWEIMLTGEFSVTLDDMGRISLPKRMRDALGENSLVLKRGDDGCIWLFTAEKKKKMEDNVVMTTNIYLPQDRAMRRRHTTSDVEIDKQGRILIPPTFRKYAGLFKECIVLGQFEYIEIWAEDRYEAYLDASKEEYRVASEELGARKKKEGNFGDYGSSPHSGSAGTDAAVPGAEGQE